MSKIKSEKKAPRVNGRLNHAHDNPYLTPSHIELDPFRCKMQDVINLYLYMSQPDHSHPVIRRPKHVPFLRRNLYYMQKDVNYSTAKPNGRYKGSVPSLLNSFQADNSDTEEFLCSCMCPSLTFSRVRFDDHKKEYDYADIRCFRARQIDGQFGRTEPVEAAHFHMRLNEELKIDIDLPNFGPDIPENAQIRNDYLLLKVEMRPDGISVSGGRKLRSVPARQAAQSELKHAQDPEHPAASQPEIKLFFGLQQITSARQDQQGQHIREGRTQIMLIPAVELGINTESEKWQQDVDFVSRILKVLKNSAGRRLPFMRVEVFVEDENATYSTCGSALSSARTTPAPVDRHRNGTDSASGYASSSASSVTNTSFCGATNTNIEQNGILGIVSGEHRSEMIKAKMPARIAWCFKMSNGEPEKPLKNQADPMSNAAYLSSLTDPPPADVFRFTGNECVICSPGYRRPFPTFVSLLYHLSSVHPRLSFKWTKTTMPASQSKNTSSTNDTNESIRRTAFSPNGSQKSDSSSTIRRRSQMVKIEPESDNENDQKPQFTQCPGFIVSLNRQYNGAHEFDSSRHYIKRLSDLRRGIGIRRRPEAWNRPPIFLVVKNLARYLRSYPPVQSLDELVSRGIISDGTFGGSAQWLDPHFHTKSYSQCHAPFKNIIQRRRISDFIDVNDNEKEMLKLLSDFHASFRTILMNHQTYGSNVIFVREQRETLLRPSLYTQFIIHLSNLKSYGNLHAAEFLDLVSRLNYGPDYDPRSDSKHFVHITLKQLEKQRPVHLENQKRNGTGKQNQVALNSRESSTASTSSTVSNESGSKQKPLGIMTRKRSFDGSAGTNSSTGTSTVDSKRVKSGILMTINETEGEKKRQFKTRTPMDILLQNTILKPEQVPVSCFDDLACRYQFAPEKQLRLIWHFCRYWTRKCLEWQ